MTQTTGPSRSEVERAGNSPRPERYSTSHNLPNGRFPAARAFPNIGPMVVDARYAGPQVETVTKKIHRSEFRSLIIVILVLFGACLVTGIVAFLAGWLG